MLLEQLLQQPGDHQITHVFVREHVTFFKVDGESFCTAAGYVKHKDDPMFDGAIIRIQAAEQHDPEMQIKVQKRDEQWQYEDELWDKHGDDVLGALILKAAEILVHQGPEIAIAFLYEHLTIIPDEQAKLMAKKLEDELK